jgi:hypothetical protein
MRGRSPSQDAAVQWFRLTSQTLEANTGDRAKDNSAIR